MAEAILKVEARDTTGKKAAKDLRRAGKIPGVYYFHGQQNISLAVDRKMLHAAMTSEASVIDLDLGKGKKLPTIIREIQWDPITAAPIHVDFLGVKLDEEVTVEVPLHLVGTPVGVRVNGGVLQQLLRSIEVECLPLDIPEHIEVDVNELDINDTIHVSDLKVEKVKILNEPDTLILSILPPRLEEEPAAAEAAEEEPAEPEVIGKGKQEEGEEQQQEED